MNEMLPDMRLIGMRYGVIMTQALRDRIDKLFEQHREDITWMLDEWGINHPVVVARIKADTEAQAIITSLLRELEVTISAYESILDELTVVTVEFE
jgi:hypothetical protein